MAKTKVIIIGGGNMGEAIFKKIRQKFSVYICEADSKRRAYLKRTYKIKPRDFNQVFKTAKVIILAVKPQNIDSVLEDIKPFASKGKIILSIAAGITSSYIEKKLGKGVRVIRTMPNMPAQIGEGITAIAKGKGATQADVNLSARILKEVGQTVVVKEDLIDAVTAVSGSGPAYVFLFVECMMKAAESLGLKKSLSKELVYATIKGSGNLLSKSGIEASTLRAKVTSKGGTTQAAMDVFQKHKITKVFEEALKASKKRAKQLSRR